MNELRECPSCGGRDLGVFLGAVLSQVVCQSCGAEAPETQWNFRATDTFTVTPAGKAALRGDS